jgi:hypothetical protein
MGLRSTCKRGAFALEIPGMRDISRVVKQYLPDLIDLLVTKQRTGRQKDLMDIMFLEMKAESGLTSAPPMPAARVGAPWLA